MAQSTSRIPKSLQKILPTAKRMMSRKTFMEGITQQAALDKNKKLGKQTVKRMAIAEAMEAPLPGSHKQQLDFTDLEKKKFGLNTKFTSKDSAIRAYQSGAKATQRDEERELTPQEKRKQERLKEAEERNTRESMKELAQERRAEANMKEAGGGGLKQQTQVSVTGRAEEKQHGWAKAEEKGWKAEKESEEKEKIESKDDWKNNPVVNPVSD